MQKGNKPTNLISLPELFWLIVVLIAIIIAVVGWYYVMHGGFVKDTTINIYNTDGPSLEVAHVKSSIPVILPKNEDGTQHVPMLAGTQYDIEYSGSGCTYHYSGGKDHPISKPEIVPMVVPTSGIQPGDHSVAHTVTCIYGKSSIALKILVIDIVSPEVGPDGATIVMKTDQNIKTSAVKTSHKTKSKNSPF